MNKRFLGEQESDEIRRLKSDLDMARYTIIDLMTDEISTLLRGFHSC